MRNGPVGKTYPSRKDAEGNPLCAFCGAELKVGLRRWCRRQCQEDAYALTYRDSAAWRVRDRDAGICADCGIDTIALRKAMVDLGLNRPWSGGEAQKALAAELRKRGFKTGGELWEMHHVKPVVAGGTYELSNLVTLCVPCHKARHATRRTKAGP